MSPDNSNLQVKSHGEMRSAREGVKPHRRGAPTMETHGGRRRQEPTTEKYGM